MTILPYDRVWYGGMAEFAEVASSGDAQATGDRGDLIERRHRHDPHNISVSQNRCSAQEPERVVRRTKY